MLEKVKMALRITTNAFNDELNHLINACKIDLQVAGVVNIDDTDSLVAQAIITYCKYHFGEPHDPERLKRSYDEQKAQMVTNSLYGKMA